MQHLGPCYNTPMRAYLLTALIGAATIIPYAVSAAGMPDRIVPCSGIDCGCADLAIVAQNIINASIFVAVFLSAILFAWAGWKMISGKSVGSGEAVGQAKEILWNVIIGLVVIIAAWLIVDTIVKTITANGTVQGVWNTICPK